MIYAAFSPKLDIFLVEFCFFCQNIQISIFKPDLFNIYIQMTFMIVLIKMTMKKVHNSIDIRREARSPCCIRFLQSSHRYSCMPTLSMMRMPTLSMMMTMEKSLNKTFATVRYTLITDAPNCQKA